MAGEAGWRACRRLVRFGDQIDLLLNHFKANDGVRVGTEDRRALRKARRRACGVALETKIGAGVDRLHDHRSIFEADDQDRFVMFSRLRDSGGLSAAGRNGDYAGKQGRNGQVFHD